MKISTSCFLEEEVNSLGLWVIALYFICVVVIMMIGVLVSVRVDDQLGDNVFLLLLFIFTVCFVCMLNF